MLIFNIPLEMCSMKKSEYDFGGLNIEAREIVVEEMLRMEVREKSRRNVRTTD